MTMPDIVFSTYIAGVNVVVQARPAVHRSLRRAATFAWSRGCPFMTGTTVT